MRQFNSSRTDARLAEIVEAKAARVEQRQLKERRMHRLAHQVRRAEGKEVRRYV